MARKLPHGLKIWDLLVDLIMGLSPLQAEKLYAELLPRYSRRAKTKLYNADGDEDSEKGKIRLTAIQYKAIRTKYGDTFMHKAFGELTNYIEFMERNPDRYKTQLKKYNSGTHNLFFQPDGWVYEKCKQYIVKDRPKINVNPYLIDDINTAREYIKCIPKQVRAQSLDVQMLLQKFPELLDVDYEG